MNYAHCTICDAVYEHRTFGSNYTLLEEHIRKSHPDTVTQLAKEWEEYEAKIAPLRAQIDAIPEPKRIRDLMTDENMSKKDGRKEFEDKIANMDDVLAREKREKESREWRKTQMFLRYYRRGLTNQPQGD